MNYFIKTNGNMIAKFEYKIDRDTALKALQDKYIMDSFDASERRILIKTRPLKRKPNE